MNKVKLCRDSDKVVCDLMHHHESAINATLIQREQFRSFSIAVTLGVSTVSYDKLQPFFGLLPLFLYM